MNIAYYRLFHLAEDPLYGSSRDGAYRAREAMLALSMTALRRNLAGLDAVHIRGGSAATWDALFHGSFEDIRRLTSEGHNVMLMGTDSLLLRPYEGPWTRPRLALWAKAGVPFEGEDGTILLSADLYRRIGQAFFPAHLPESLWDSGERAWARPVPGRHDTEMYVYSLMYYYQQDTDSESDLDARMDYAGDDPPPPDALFRHYHATRNPELALTRMLLDSRLL